MLRCVHRVAKLFGEINPEINLKCLGADHDLNGYCQGYSAQQSTDESDIRTGEYEYLHSNLRDIMKLRGFKIVHQNIQSLRNKIDQLRLIMHELKSGIHLLALTETWAKSDMLDSEFRDSRLKTI